MAAPTETYVDPSIDGNSGSGTIGDPYGDLQHALDTMTRDATNGDRINIKAGTDEVLTGDLDLTTYGTPSSGAPLIFQGYTSSAGDGGIGGIDADGACSVLDNTTLDYTMFVDLHLHNADAGGILRMRNDGVVLNCEIDGSSGDGVEVDLCQVVGCYVHNVGGVAIEVAVGVAMSNWVDEAGANTPTIGIALANIYSVAVNNIIVCSGTMKGITSSHGVRVLGNTIWSNGGTGKGIEIASYYVTVANNIVEGFSGAGGTGISCPDPYAKSSVVESNAVYNCTTAYNLGHYYGGNNDTLAASPFTDAANDDFSIGTDADVMGDGYPTGWPGGGATVMTTNYLSKGAAQRDSSSTGGGRRPRIRWHGV